MAVTIQPDGTVFNVSVIESNPKRLFDKAAIAAMKRWKFRPKIVDGNPVAQRARQTIEFKLGNSHENKKFIILLKPASTDCLMLSLQSVISFADSVSTKTYRELTAIQELMSSARTNRQLEVGHHRLEILLDNVSEESLDEALTLQTLGYALMADEQFEEAIIQLRKSLDTKKLPQNVTLMWATW